MQNSGGGAVLFEDFGDGTTTEQLTVTKSGMYLISPSLG